MGLFGFAGDLLKSKVKVPAFKEVTPSGVESQALRDYNAGLEEATKFADTINAANQASMDRQLKAKIPGFADIGGKISSNISDELSGRLPDDVVAQIMRKSAAKSIEGGYGGSEFARNLTSRDLGLTSLQMTQQGLSNALNWITNVRQNQLAPSMSPSSLFLTPETRLNLAVSERDKALNRNYLANQLKAAQSWQTSMGNQLNNFDQLLTSVAASYAGGLGGMLGGMGGGFGGGGGGSGGASGFSVGPAASAGGWATM